MHSTAPGRSIPGVSHPQGGLSESFERVPERVGATGSQRVQLHHIFPFPHAGETGGRVHRARAEPQGWSLARPFFFMLVTLSSSVKREAC